MRLQWINSNFATVWRSGGPHIVSAIDVRFLVYEELAVPEILGYTPRRTCTESCRYGSRASIPRGWIASSAGT